MVKIDKTKHITKDGIVKKNPKRDKKIWVGGKHSVSHNKIEGYDVEEHYATLHRRYEDGEIVYELVGHSDGRFACDCLDGLETTMPDSDEEAIEWAEAICEGLEYVVPGGIYNDYGEYTGYRRAGYRNNAVGKLVPVIEDEKGNEYTNDEYDVDEFGNIIIKDDKR